MAPLSPASQGLQGRACRRFSQQLIRRTQERLEAYQAPEGFTLAGAFQERPGPHRFRHTFVRILIKRDVPVGDVAELVGDIERVLLRYYAKRIPSRQAGLSSILKEAFRDEPKPIALVSNGPRRLGCRTISSKDSPRWTAAMRIDLPANGWQLNRYRSICVDVSPSIPPGSFPPHSISDSSSTRRLGCFLLGSPRTRNRGTSVTLRGQPTGNPSPPSRCSMRAHCSKCRIVGCVSDGSMLIPTSSDSSIIHSAIVEAFGDTSSMIPRPSLRDGEML